MAVGGLFAGRVMRHREREERVRVAHGAGARRPCAGVGAEVSPGNSLLGLGSASLGAWWGGGCSLPGSNLTGWYGGLGSLGGSFAVGWSLVFAGSSLPGGGGRIACEPRSL